MFGVLSRIFKTGCLTEQLPVQDEAIQQLGSACQREITRIFGKSMAIRMIDAAEESGA